MASDNENQGVVLDDYVAMEKADAFCQMYDPSPTEFGADEVWHEARIREFFTAYVEKSHGDTLPLYLDRLKRSGHQLRVSTSGDLCLFVRYHRAGSADSDIAGMLTGNDGDKDEGESNE